MLSPRGTGVQASAALALSRGPSSATRDAAPDSRQEETLRAGADSHLISLWIDLVTEATTARSPRPLPNCAGLTRQPYRVLSCLQSERLTMTALARPLGIKPAAATAAVDRLVEAGAAERTGDTLDRRLVYVAATVAGVQMASRHRASQIATLEALLAQLEPTRREALAVAMEALASALSSAPTGTTDNMLTPDPKRWSPT